MYCDKSLCVRYLQIYINAHINLLHCKSYVHYVVIFFSLTRQENFLRSWQNHGKSIILWKGENGFIFEFLSLYTLYSPVTSLAQFRRMLRKFWVRKRIPQLQNSNLGIPKRFRDTSITKASVRAMSYTLYRISKKSSFLRSDCTEVEEFLTMIDFTPRNINFF